MRSRWTLPVSLVLVTGLLVAGSAVRTELIDCRQAEGLAEMDITELDPLGAAGLLLMGGFRGVAVNVLWIKAMALHSDRAYHEERGILELIAKLQPYCISVWVHQGWNIAYNISVEEPDPKDQWKWVKEGIGYLEDGIELNPHNPDLHFYLAWYYRDKVAQNHYFEDIMEKPVSEGGLGANNFELSAETYKRARELGKVMTFSYRVVYSGVYHAHMGRAKQIFRRATLDENLSFEPETLEKAKPFIKMAREEAAALLHKDRWPDDLAFVWFPARIDMIMCDAYGEQVDKILDEGDYSEAALAKARKVLEKELTEARKYHGTYSKYVSIVPRQKMSDALIRISEAYLNHRGEMIRDKPFDEARKRRELELLRVAEEQARMLRARLGLTDTEEAYIAELNRLYARGVAATRKFEAMETNEEKQEFEPKLLRIWKDYKDVHSKLKTTRDAVKHARQLDRIIWEAVSETKRTAKRDVLEE